MTLFRLALAVPLVALIACGAPATTPDAGVDIDNPPAKSFRVLLTGEEFAQIGYAFPPTAGQEVSFRDGWEVKYTRLIIVADKLTLSENPDRSPTDQSQTGDLVAQLDGPWAVDVVRGGSFADNSAALAVFTAQNKKGNAPFDSTAKYAFGYDTIAATAAAKKVNLDAAGETAFANMVSKGYTMWMEGTATFKGTGCRVTTIAGQPAYDFERIPKVVNFKFGWTAPTTYKNCINPSIAEDARGVQVRDNAAVDVLVTYHVDHPFWEALTEDAPLRWDALAARKSSATAPAPSSVELTEADLKTVDFQAFEDAQGTALPIRYCGAPEASELTTGQLKYDPSTVPVGGTSGLKDLYDFMQYNLSTFGHLNADGLCFPARNYSSP